MITFDAFLVFLCAVALPVTYIFICSRWLEPEYRSAKAEKALPKPLVQPTSLAKAA